MKNIILIALILFANVSFAQKNKKIDEGNNRFAFDLYHQLDKKDKNIFLSPYSISTALAMTYTGAGGTTATEMGQVMGFLSDPSANNEAFKTLIGKINSRNNDDIKMKVANRLFGDQNFKFNEEYLSTVKESFGAPLEKVNFKDKEACRNKINTWVEEQTNHKIKDLIKKNALPDSTKLVLVNAIYFYGDWAKQFDSTNTQKKKFYVSSEKTIDHKIMYQKSYFEYMENDSYQAIRLPYKGNQLYMEIYLPNKKDGINEFEKSFDFSEWEKCHQKFRQEEIILNLPKFKMTCDFSLGDHLQSMGMKTAFTDAADFFGMVQKGEEGLKISKVIHKAFIDVGEKGTEAAAATAVIMIQTTSVAHIDRKEPKYFNADHPFIFMIKDRETNSILFMGKVMNPAL